MESARRIYQDKMDELWGEMHSIDPDLLISVENKENFQIGDKAFQAWHTLSGIHILLTGESNFEQLWFGL